MKPASLAQSFNALCHFGAVHVSAGYLDGNLGADIFNASF